MKKTIAILSILMCMLALFMLSGCKSLYNKKYVYDGTSLIGKWIDEDLNENSYDTYEFVDEQNVILTTNCRGIALRSIKGTYTVEDNNKIVITSDAFGKEYIRFSITKDSRLVILTLDDMDIPSEDERVMTKYDLSYNKGENKLIGTWVSKESPDEKFIFNEDFSGKSVGLTSLGEVTEYKIYYSFKENELNIIVEYMIGYEEMVRTAEYKIENNTLTMSGKDKDGKKIEILFEREN